MLFASNFLFLIILDDGAFDFFVTEYSEANELYNLMKVAFNTISDIL